ncbi:alkaline ceramidase 3-like [Clytia hemisphaerica]|uniref:Alkaline ceramidase n=1 Tax=Clytia hemisphaerica TaxID=252671 RepID=A0A7M6DNL4_9CNID
MSPPMYRDSSSGYWGFPSSTMDWCEENYAVTSYVAEFWNTVSNVVFVVPPLLTAYHLWKHKLSELGPIVCFLLLTVVGFGSFAFHCTLLYHSQLLDELPMIYGTCAMLYCIIEIRSPKDSVNKSLIVILISISLSITLIYGSLKNPLIFLWSYGVLAAALFILNIRGCLNYNGSPKLLASASFNYGFGFILWNLDNEYCYRVRDTRKSLPGLIAPVTQLHAWWHFFAGVGTFLTIVYIIHLRLTCLGVNPFLQFLHGFFPYYSQKVGRSYEETKFQQDINGNTVPSVKLKNGRSNNSVGNFARLL